jgi:uroporphyrinogen decarboxylase
VIDRSEKPILKALRGVAVEPTPVWLMRQAGRYLPEYRAIRSKSPDFLSLCFTPALATEVTLQPIRRFGFDAAILFSDILVIPHALGQRVWFAEGEGPRLEPLSSITNLKPGRTGDALAPVLETVATLRAQLPQNTTLIGFAGAPWTVATYMTAGRGGDDGNAALELAYRAPADFKALIDTLVEATAEYLIAQVRAGAEVLQIFESWAGTIPAQSVDAFSVQPIKRIVTLVRQSIPDVPVIVFPRGAGSNLARYAGETGANAISVDTNTPLAAARLAVGAKTTLQGNLDPLAFIQGGEALRGAVRSILHDTKGTPHIFNLGHGIRPETPIAHVEEMLRLVRNPGA